MHEHFIVMMQTKSDAASVDFDIADRCKAEKQAEQLCGNYTAILDKAGNGALKGVLAYEGYTACNSNSPSLQSALLSTSPAVLHD